MKRVSISETRAVALAAVLAGAEGPTGREMLHPFSRCFLSGHVRDTGAAGAGHRRLNPAMSGRHPGLDNGEAPPTRRIAARASPYPVTTALAHPLAWAS